MKAYKWDFTRREYDEVELPDTCATYRTDFDEMVTCPSCRREVRFGDTFTSRCYHDRVGFGYGVCPDCHEAEFEAEMRYAGKGKGEVE